MRITARILFLPPAAALEAAPCLDLPADQKRMKKLERTTCEGAMQWLVFHPSFQVFTFELFQPFLPGLEDVVDTQLFQNGFESGLVGASICELSCHIS
jgi:hypothetical protein